jgi:hypothetical protein
MAASVGNGVSGMLRPACQLTGLFMLGTTVSVGGWAVRLSQSTIRNHYTGKLIFDIAPMRKVENESLEWANRNFKHRREVQQI